MLLRVCQQLASTVQYIEQSLLLLVGYTVVWSGIHEYNECIPRETMI